MYTRMFIIILGLGLLKDNSSASYHSTEIRRGSLSLSLSPTLYQASGGGGAPKNSYDIDSNITCINNLELTQGTLYDFAKKKKPYKSCANVKDARMFVILVALEIKCLVYAMSLLQLIICTRCTKACPGGGSNEAAVPGAAT